MSVQEQVLLLSKPEKIKVMEALWVDLSLSEESYSSPAWHERELEETAERVRSGDEKELDWAEAKRQLRAK